jgi:hypothetical protein
LVQELLGNFAALYPLVHEIAIKTFRSLVGISTGGCSSMDKGAD